LRSLVARQGRVLDKPPAWFHPGKAGSEFLIGIAGRYVLPVVRAPMTVHVVPARPWLATTFVARDLGSDLCYLSGRDLVAITFFPQRVLLEWASRQRGVAEHCAPDLLAEVADLPAGSDALTARPAMAAGRAEIHVRVRCGTLVLIRAARNEGHGARLRATGWVQADPRPVLFSPARVPPTS
jgi:hypothetical protein